METLVEIPKRELKALLRIAKTGDELAQALCDSYDVTVEGSDFEFQFAAFIRALGRSPEHCKEGRYLWKEIEEDWLQDARGG
ncbi:MAG: hypothetical protein GTO63_14105 [Anaerolineae bacterium]|nr:hypothetical protein [Anaerolineae bacterium]NIN95979.1 hypothetical protein [Anaerolineae bacterium]